MKTFLRRRPAWAICSLALAGVCATAAMPLGNAERAPLRRAAAAAPAETEARVIVKYKADSTLMRALSVNSGSAAPPQHAEELGGRLGLALIDGRTIGARAQVVRGTGMSSQQLAQRLGAQSDVEYAVVDERKFALAAPNDPRYAAGQLGTPAAGQWYLRAPTSATIADATSIVSSINAEAAWNVSTGSSAVVVAVLDTGVRFDHPDLAGKLRSGYDFVAGNGSAASIAIANDGDGRDADPSDPGDWITSAEDNLSGGQFYHCGDKDPNTGQYVGAPSSWHGTQTSGLIGAATNNGIGMAGAGRDVMLLPVRVLGKCGGYDSDIQAAMLWAAGLSASPNVNPYPAKVINLSLGATGTCSQSYADTVKTLNDNRVVVVAAAGNDGLAVGTPANCAGVIAVAGVRHAGTKVGYSDLGPEIAIAAPAGNCVNSSGTCLFPLLTTSNSGTTTPVSNVSGGSIYTDGGSNASLGTSFSSPLVAGTVGLMISANANLTPSQLRYAMTSTARAFPQTGAGASIPVCTAPTATAQSSECYCTTATCGAGLLDAGLAVTRAAGAAAIISASATSVTAGAAIDLNASGSWPGAGASSSLGYQWTITAGSATFSGPTNASTATVVTTGSGAVTATLTVTDSLGRQASSNVGLNVAAAPVAPSSGGGGAMNPAWLLGWLAAVLAVWAITPRGRRR